MHERVLPCNKRALGRLRSPSGHHVCCAQITAALHAAGTVTKGAPDILWPRCHGKPTHRTLLQLRNHGQHTSGAKTRIQAPPWRVPRTGEHERSPERGHSGRRQGKGTQPTPSTSRSGQDSTPTSPQASSARSPWASGASPGDAGQPLCSHLAHLPWGRGACAPALAGHGLH